MNRPELDVSTERLKMRSNIETEVTQILKKCGFERVFLSPTGTMSEDPNEEQRTKWDRNLQLYKRC